MITDLNTGRTAPNARHKMEKGTTTQSTSTDSPMGLFWKVLHHFLSRNPNSDIRLLWGIIGPQMGCVTDLCLSKAAGGLGKKWRPNNSTTRKLSEPFLYIYFLS